MKRWLKMMLLTGCVIGTSLASREVNAGGILKYHVKVKNDIAVEYWPSNGTPIHTTCTVYLYRPDNTYQVATIAAGATHTFTVNGPHCPARLAGTCQSDYGPPVSMYNRCLTGKESWGSLQCTAACWSSDWFIRRSDTDRSLHFHKE